VLALGAQAETLQGRVTPSLMATSLDVMAEDTRIRVRILDTTRQNDRNHTTIACDNHR